MSFTKLIERWAASETPETTPEAYAIHLDVEDAARVEALTELFPGVTVENVISDLLKMSLDELEAAMPYEPGDKVIREDEFGDPVYEDAGLTPRFRELVRARVEAG